MSHASAYILHFRLPNRKRSNLGEEEREKEKRDGVAVDDPVVHRSRRGSNRSHLDRSFAEDREISGRLSRFGAPAACSQHRPFRCVSDHGWAYFSFPWLLDDQDSRFLHILIFFLSCFLL